MPGSQSSLLTHGHKSEILYWKNVFLFYCLTIVLYNKSNKKINLDIVWLFFSLPGWYQKTNNRNNKKTTTTTTKLLCQKSCIVLWWCWYFLTFLPPTPLTPSPLRFFIVATTIKNSILFMFKVMIFAVDFFFGFGFGFGYSLVWGASPVPNVCHINFFVVATFFFCFLLHLIGNRDLWFCREFHSTQKALARKLANQLEKKCHHSQPPPKKKKTKSKIHQNNTNNNNEIVKMFMTKIRFFFIAILQVKFVKNCKRLGLFLYSILICSLLLFVTDRL